MEKLFDFRVSLDPKAHLALEVLAAQKHVSMKVLASAIIWQGVGPAARSFAEQSGVRGEDLPEVIVTQGDVEISPKLQTVSEPNIQLDKGPKDSMEQGRGTSTDSGSLKRNKPAPISEPHSVANKFSPEGRKLQLRISKNPEVQRKIKELWEGTDLTREQISIKVGYPRATVQKWINTCLDNKTYRPREKA